MATGTLFHPFRALGYVTANVPFAVQRRGRNTFLTVSAGKAWQLYNCAKLTLIFVGQPVRARRRRAASARGAPQLALRRRRLLPCDSLSVTSRRSRPRTTTRLPPMAHTWPSSAGETAPPRLARKRAPSRAWSADATRFCAQSAPHRHVARRGRRRGCASSARRPSAVALVRRRGYGTPHPVVCAAAAPR